MLDHVGFNQISSAVLIQVQQILDVCVQCGTALTERKVSNKERMPFTGHDSLRAFVSSRGRRLSSSSIDSSRFL
jgi:hypothetical protein